jgi:hypothetical protein
MISPPTSFCENTIWLQDLVSFYLVPFNSSPSSAG